MNRHGRPLRRALGAALVLALSSLATFAPIASRPAAAATYPDIAGQPVAFGDVSGFGAPGGHLAAPIVGMAETPTDHGYWLVASDGGVFAFGDARYYGSTGALKLAKPVVGIAATPTGRGYWLVASDGGIFSFGDARFHGSTGGVALAKPIVGMAAAPTGSGYWLVASDGGIFSFGDARYHGSTGAVALRKPVVGMAATPTGNGYWLVASDGGTFSFGDAGYHGSTGAVALRKPVVGMAATPTGNGYWLVASDGGIFSFGDARFLGSMGGQRLQNPIGVIAAARHSAGYWLLPTVAPAPPGTLSTPLTIGDSGPAVLALQQRLSALGYWTGTPDGSFGDATQQAVYALQKAAGLTPDGTVGASTNAALNAGVVPHARSASGRVVEVNLANDLVMFVSNGKVDQTLNTSTGGGYTYTDGGVTSVAQTPTGQFQIYREVDGMVTDSLGQLWRPKFFYEGFAIHGDSFVPPYPVSHGCVRVSNEAIDWIWANNLLPIGTPVWVY